MEAALRYVHSYRRSLIVAGLLLLGTVLCLQNLAFYLRFNFNLALTLMALPLCMEVHKHRVSSWRYGLLSLLFLMLYPLLKTQSLFFMGYCCFLLFVVENHLGRLSILPLVLLVLSSPFALFAMEVIGFPLRLQLTEWAAEICRWSEPDIQVAGNTLILQGFHFRVDPVCMGLKMLNTSLVLGVGFLAFQQRQLRKQIRIGWIATYLGIVFLAVLLSNLLRIVLTVHFRAMPETASHELLGLICLVVYVLLPAYGLAWWVVRRKGQPRSTESSDWKWFSSSANSIAPSSKSGKMEHSEDAGSGAFPIPSRGIYALCSLLLLALLIINFNRDEFRITPNKQELNTAELAGFERQVNQHQVVQYQSDQALIYVKPGVTFYGADHTPLICWKGSGYEFHNESTIVVNDQKVFAAELRGPEGKLYTAWWYDNGRHQTIDQLDWRWRMAKGEPSFRLINVTCDSQATLHHQIEILLAQSLIPETP